MPTAQSERRATVAAMLPLAAAALQQRRAAGTPAYAQPPPQNTVPLWAPLAGPQTTAYLSLADELYYGGAAGGGKTDLLLGIALTNHTRSVLFRREYGQLRGIIERLREIVGSRGRFNETAGLWRIGTRTLELGAVQYEWDKDKWQGRPHAFVGFDELPQFSLSQYLYLTGWARTTNPHERVRIAGAGNPPLSPEGEWVIERWGAWLDAQHPNPAEPGELRWYAMLENTDVEVEDGAPFDFKGELVYPKSRTFIPARVSDNPLLVKTNYVATLQSLAEPLRSQVLYGDFSAGALENPWQVLPTAWVEAAMARWVPDGRADDHGVLAPLDQIGADIAQGGNDRTVLAYRYVDWWAELEEVAGVDLPDADANAQLVLAALARGGIVRIDGDGIGASTYHLVVGMLPPEHQGRVRLYRGSAPAPDHFRDKTGLYGFANVRAAAWWKLREALDPDSGDNLALPPDRGLKTELCAPQYKLTVRGIQLEAKEDVKKRLGKSIDLADAVVMSDWIDPRETYARAFGAIGKVASPAATVRRVGDTRSRGAPGRHR